MCVTSGSSSNIYSAYRSSQLLYEKERRAERAGPVGGEQDVAPRGRTTCPTFLSVDTHNGGEAAETWASSSSGIHFNIHTSHSTLLRGNLLNQTPTDRFLSHGAEFLAAPRPMRRDGAVYAQLEPPTGRPRPRAPVRRAQLEPAAPADSDRAPTEERVSLMEDHAAL